MQSCTTGTEPGSWEEKSVAHIANFESYFFQRGFLGFELDINHGTETVAGVVFKPGKLDIIQTTDIKPGATLDVKRLDSPSLVERPVAWFCLNRPEWATLKVDLCPAEKAIETRKLNTPICNFGNRFFR